MTNRVMAFNILAETSGTTPQASLIIFLLFKRMVLTQNKEYKVRISILFIIFA